MAFGADHAVLLDRLDEELRHAPEPAQDLFAGVIAHACNRNPALGNSGRAASIGRLIEAGAWTDAAFALIELELPGWKVRRLAYETGEWFCSLSRQPNLPITLDDTADAGHESMPLAILCAFLQARRKVGESRQAVTSVPQVAPSPGGLICCDNFV
jgi:hypothetical protein